MAEKKEGKELMKNIIQINNGVLTTTTWIVAAECNRRHNKVVEAIDGLISESHINLPEFRQIEVTDSKGRSQKAYELTEAGFLAAMPYICGVKGKQGQRLLVDEFIRLRKQIEQGHNFLQLEQKEQASIAGRGPANWRWCKPVFDAQLSLPLAEVVGIEGRK
ncbi:Rha family transcriptional regulator [Salinisphaera sp. G21_0]|uniref:Rha family transcriptional regulator n=1 Tax=Salinisphaera sp. G21_0 TaxID=2821094 RepID=UPI001ADB9BCF|nr:Rha family transcriptional regulator [Salinisphaera sp. G21_0]MBO9484346.1 Rha family transcriptional regulator [Salinisphaera sp. G21_0]